MAAKRFSQALGLSIFPPALRKVSAPRGSAGTWCSFRGAHTTGRVAHTSRRLPNNFRKKVFALQKLPVKIRRGEPGHTRDTQAHTRTLGGHRRTSQASKPIDTPARPRDSRNPKPVTRKLGAASCQQSSAEASASSLRPRASGPRLGRHRVWRCLERRSTELHPHGPSRPAQGG